MVTRRRQSFKTGVHSVGNEVVAWSEQHELVPQPSSQTQAREVALAVTDSGSPIILSLTMATAKLDVGLG